MRDPAGPGSDFDTILIDCPPSLGLLTLNGLVAATSVMVPLQCEFFALEGISALTRTIEAVRRGLNRDLRLEGIVLTMFDRRNNLSELVAADARGFFGGDVFETMIPRNIRLSEAPSHGQPVLAYDPRSSGAVAYGPARDRVSRAAGRCRIVNERGKPKRLGRGLAALMGDLEPMAAPSGQGLRVVPVGALVPSPFQPRREMAEGDLEELAASIRAQGLLQPILVRLETGNTAPERFQIVAGERRWRACQLAGLEEVSVLVRTFDDSQAAAAALIENLQRVDLNAIEEAGGPAPPRRRVRLYAGDPVPSDRQVAQSRREHASPSHSAGLGASRRQARRAQRGTRTRPARSARPRHVPRSR